MPYNLAYLRERVLDDKLDDDSIDPTIIDGFLNDTQASIFNTYELPHMEKIFEGALPVGEYSFQFPTDYSILQSMIIQSADGFQKSLAEFYLPFREFNKMYPVPLTRTAGQPQYWTTFANRFLVDKPTDTIYTLTMFYLRNPTPMTTDTSVPDLPQSFEEALVLGAYIRALQRNEDYDLADKVIVEYNRQLLPLTTRSTKRQSGQPVTISQPQRTGRILRSRR